MNDADYPDGQPAQDVTLGAMGFDATGHRGGGIERPQVQTLPKNAVLLRLYKPVLKKGEFPGDFGTWWFTPFEYRRICDHFGVDGSVLVAGRAGGKSALHGVLALLQEWYGGSPAQLSYINAIRLKEPLLACYGAGAPANADGYTRTLKPIRLGNGSAARQVYIHKCWDYQSAMERLLPANASTDSVLGASGGPPKTIASAPRLPFET
ncbi:MAG: hypothetical protein ACJAVM_002138 [Sulfitobacter sp.]|jgi:hypothetical protein